jgi:hypothetical protein
VITNKCKKIGRESKFRKDFSPEEYLAYLRRKAESPDFLTPEDNETQSLKLKSKKKAA